MSSLHIEPKRITNYNRSGPQLEAFCFYAYLAAGYTARVVAPVVNRWLDDEVKEGETPLSSLRRICSEGKLASKLKDYGFHGQINRRLIGMPQLANLDLCGFYSLPISHFMANYESVFGVGPKTARFVALHSRPGVEVAVLDRHILKYLESIGYRVPRFYKTPEKGPRYDRLEAAFLKACHDLGVSPEVMDLKLWSDMAN